MSESTEDSLPATRDPDIAVLAAPSLDVPSNRYSDIFGLFPSELFDGFEEFVRESRRQSGFGREPPPWW